MGNNYKNQVNVPLTKKMVKKRTADNIASLVLFVVFAAFAATSIIMLFIVNSESIQADDFQVYNVLKFAFAGVAIILFMALLFSVKSSIRTRKALNNNEFVVYVDVLGDKDEETSTDSEGHSSTYYYFYFNHFFRNFKKRVSASYTEYKDAQIGDEFFIVYVIPTKKVVAFKVGKYQLDYDLRSKLTDTANMDNYFQDDDTNYVGSNTIDEKALLERFEASYQTGGNAIIGAVLAIVFIIFAGFIVSHHFVVAGFMALFFVVFFVSLKENIKKNNKAKQAIAEGKYSIVSTIITEDVTEKHIKNADLFLFFKVKDSDQEIICPYNDFRQANAGDEIYLFYFHQGVFIDTSKPFAVLNPNKHHLTSSIQSKLSIY